jgi:hypothetical protein
VKSLHRLLVAAHHGRFKRRSTGQISRFEIGAQLDEQLGSIRRAVRGRLSISRSGGSTVA